MKVINYNGQQIEYHIEYKKIKNLYIQIKDKKVLVKAPKFLKEKYIDDFVNKKAKWIWTKLNEEKQNQIEKDYTEEDYKKLEVKLNKIYNKLINTTKLVPNKIRIRNIKYAWGTCSANKNITINLKLVDKSDEEIEYVVLHELCHLKYMNHSKKFWELVEKYMPNYKEIRKKLKHNR